MTSAAVLFALLGCAAISQAAPHCQGVPKGSRPCRPPKMYPVAVPVAVHAPAPAATIPELNQLLALLSALATQQATATAPTQAAISNLQALLGALSSQLTTAATTQVAVPNLQTLQSLLGALGSTQAPVASNVATANQLAQLQNLLTLLAAARPTATTTPAPTAGLTLAQLQSLLGSLVG